MSTNGDLPVEFDERIFVVYLDLIVRAFLKARSVSIDALLAAVEAECELEVDELNLPATAQVQLSAIHAALVRLVDYHRSQSHSP